MLRGYLPEFKIEIFCVLFFSAFASLPGLSRILHKFCAILIFYLPSSFAALSYSSTDAPIPSQAVFRST